MCLNICIVYIGVFMKARNGHMHTYGQNVLHILPRSKVVNTQEQTLDTAQPALTTYEGNCYILKPMWRESLHNWKSYVFHRTSSEVVWTTIICAVWKGPGSVWARALAGMGAWARPGLGPVCQLSFHSAHARAPARFWNNSCVCKGASQIIPFV